ncbi:MAG: endonuclease V [Candidatus Bathyarchaeia archaeon]
MTPERLFKLQSELSRLVDSEVTLGEVGLVAGADAAYKGDFAVACAASIDMRGMEVAEANFSSGKVAFPYIPGLFALREARILVEVFKGLGARPDVCIVDGHGVAHPRGFGLACQVGLALDLPTIGVAKRRLFGAVEGDRILGTSGEVIGAILPAGPGRRLYVSVGHRISLLDALRVVGRCMREGEVIPLAIAHRLARAKLLASSHTI